jgi:hypothetical protein
MLAKRRLRLGIREKEVGWSGDVVFGIDELHGDGLIARYFQCLVLDQ